MLDLQAGYHHIPLDESSIPTTLFTSLFVKYEYIKVPFGHTQAPELMTGVLKDFSFTISSSSANSRRTHLPHKASFQKIME